MLQIFHALTSPILHFLGIDVVEHAVNGEIPPLSVFCRRPNFL